MTMQRYNISRDGDLMKAENGYVYLASDVDASIAELEARELTPAQAQARDDMLAYIGRLEARADELEKALRDAREVLGHYTASGDDDEEWNNDDVIEQIAAIDKSLMGGSSNG